MPTPAYLQDADSCLAQAAESLHDYDESQGDELVPIGLLTATVALLRWCIQEELDEINRPGPADLRPR